MQLNLTIVFCFKLKRDTNKFINGIEFQIELESKYDFY